MSALSCCCGRLYSPAEHSGGVTRYNSVHSRGVTRYNNVHRGGAARYNDVHFWVSPGIIMHALECHPV